MSAYKETIYAAPLAKFVAHMVKEGQESEHTPEYIARHVHFAFPVDEYLDNEKAVLV